MSLPIGALVKDEQHGVCTVVSYRRTGHQYDRYYEYDLLTPAGNIITREEFCDLFRRLGEKEEIDS